LSGFPQYYRRLVTPTTWSSQHATKARDHAREWFERARIGRTKQKWESSWNEDKERESGHDENSSREPQFKKRKHYHPEEPEVDDMILCSINHNEELKATVHSEDQTMWYQVTLRQLYSDPKTLASMFRRVRGCESVPPLFTTMKHPGSRLSRVLAEAVGVRDNDIVSIRRGIQPLFDRVINQDKNCTEVPAKKSKDNKKLERQQND
jgi:hypothetical protein